jgi:hypothetical protein
MIDKYPWLFVTKAKNNRLNQVSDPCGGPPDGYAVSINYESLIDLRQFLTRAGSFWHGH